MASIGGTTWWKYGANDPDVSRAVITIVNDIQQNTLGVQTRFLRNMRSFGGYGYMTGARFPTNTGAGGPLGQGQRTGPRDNIIYTIVSTACSQLLDDGAPGVDFVTTHGDYEQQERARLLNLFTDGLMYQCGYDDEAVLALYDACICGTGFVEFFLDADNNIRCERVFPAEYMVDIFDGRDRKPQALYRMCFIDRDVLAARFPAKKKQILEVKPMMLPGWNSSMALTNVIPMVKAWHLPSSAEANDGRHIITLADDLKLYDKEYTESDFPVSVLRYELLPTGYYGMGLGELLAGHQLSLNNANTAEYWAWSQVAMPKLWFRTGTLDKNHLNSSLSAAILEGTEKPEVLNFSATHPDFVKWKGDLKAGAFQLAGVSQMSSSGVKPAGLDSGEAQREFKDTLHSRFSILSQRWMNFAVDARRKAVALGRQVYSQDKSFKVRVIGKHFLKEIKWKEAELEDDAYVMRPKPVSQIPKSVAGQIQTAVEMVQSGFWDMQSARSVITAIADTGYSADLANATYDDARHTAHKLLHEGVDLTPDGTLQDLDLCIKVVSAEALRASNNGAPKAKLDCARRFLIQARNQQTQAKQAAAAAMAPPAPPGGGQPGAGPLAQGQALPQSPLLQFKRPGMPQAA